MYTPIYLKILEYNVYCSKFNELINNKSKFIINTINPHSYYTAKKDSLFSEALKHSDLLLPDGEGIVLAARILHKQKIQKVAGSDIHRYLLNELNKTGGSVFYLGATDSTLEKIKARLNREFPNIIFHSFSPPYKPEFTETDSLTMCKAVNSFKPDVLFVGMTAPKQEKWVHLNKHQLDAKIICSIGAVFDFYAGTVKRPPEIFIKLKLEWLGRLLKEPKRMWRRNFVSLPIFLWDVFREYLKSK